MLTTVIVTPVNILKTQRESLMKGDVKLPVPKMISKIYREGGITGFHRGFGATLLRDIPFSGLQFLLY